MSAPSSAPPLDDLEPSVSRGPRLARLGAAPLALARALVVPDREVPDAVRAGRYGAALIAATFAALAAAAAIGLRVDASAAVLAPPPAREESSPAEPLSDQQLDEEIAHARAVAQVTLGLDAALGTPARALLVALALLLAGRYVGGRPTFRGALAASAHGALPGAVKALLAAAAALRAGRVRLADVDGLVGPGPLVASGATGAARLLVGVDPFLLWSVALLALGLSAAAGLSRRRAALTSLIGFALYLMVTRGLLGGGPPEGAR